MMDGPARASLSLDTRVMRADDILRDVRGPATDPAIDEVSTSWLRSADLHGVDPLDAAAPQIIAANELKTHREPLEKLIFSASGELDRLYGLVRPAGYTLLLCDMTGSVIEHRGEETEARQFAYWGTWLGGVWSEAAEGTNGIGTCIVEERPVTVHRGQHFRSRHKDLSCSGAPVFGVDGRMIAVLDVSAIDPNLSERAHGLTGTLTIAAARALEERYFREHFHREWIIVADQPAGQSGSPVMLAVDGNQRIVGANRAARGSFVLDDRALLTGTSLWSLFERDMSPFRQGNSIDVVVRLVLAGSEEACPAIITPPPAKTRATHNAANAVHHTYPRTEMLGNLRNTVQQEPTRGGLPPAAMRRVHEYMEAHLSENIDLSMLATVAGLSTYHFAREFKRSTGIAPHYYLVSKRVERAQDMLARTDSSLAEIAIAAGFADQSHLARHFRRIVGSTPREFRWSQR